MDVSLGSAGHQRAAGEWAQRQSGFRRVELCEMVALVGRRIGWGARRQGQAGKDLSDGVGRFDDAENLHAVAASSADLRVDLEDTLKHLRPGIVGPSPLW